MPESPDQAPPKRRTRAAPATSSSGFRDVENPAGMASLFIRTDTQSPPLFLLARLGCSIGPIAPAAQECRRPADLCPNPCDERGAGNPRAGESCVGTARKNEIGRTHVCTPVTNAPLGC